MAIRWSHADIGLARLSYAQARALLDAATATARRPGTGRDLHELRHSGLTHLGEAGASLLELMAKSRHRKLDNLRRYFNPHPPPCGGAPACSDQEPTDGNANTQSLMYPVTRFLPAPLLRADAMFKRLRASRLDNSTEAEMRRLAQIRLLIIDDFALQPMDATATADFYELVVARHHKASTVLTSNRSPDEFLAMMTDPLLAQSAVDRLTSTTHELVIEGQSYRRRQKPTV